MKSTLFVVIGIEMALILVAHAQNNAGGNFNHWPDTGQDRCFDAVGQIICPEEGQPFYGQDGQYQGPLRVYTKLDEFGNPLPDNAPVWVMVRDNSTGLIWEVKTDDDMIHDKDNEYDWCDTNIVTNGGSEGYCTSSHTEEYINALNSANFGGHADWRIPTIKELSTLVDTALHPAPLIDLNYFPYTKPANYWSSTTNPRSNGFAWRVRFSEGLINYSAKYNNYNVRAVRDEE